MSSIAYPRVFESEQAVLWASLTSPAAYEEARRLLLVEHFQHPAHQHIWSVMGQLHAETGAFDAAAVSLEVTRSRRGLNVLPSLQALLESRGSLGTVEYHAEQMVRAHTAGRVIDALYPALGNVQAGGEPIETAELLIERLREIQRVGEPEKHTEIDFLDVVSRVVDPGKFVVPGLLARDNRIIITAPEGYGKSSLLRQIAACSSSGVHPFRLKAWMQPITSLVIDAENPEDINTTEYRKLYDKLEALRRVPARGRLVIEECGPINVLDPRTAAKLCAQVERIQPELIVIGPLYQLHDEDANDERAARKLASFLDRLRRLSRAALVTEAHTPHSDGPNGQLLRPFGASLWKRWPEFGYCLHPAVRPKNPDRPTQEEMASLSCKESKFTPWRGARAARDWPRVLRQGNRMLWEVA